MSNNWPKICAVCNSSYDPDEWEKLNYCGVQKSVSGAVELELRNCHCDNTLSVEVIVTMEIIK